MPVLTKKQKEELCTEYYKQRASSSNDAIFHWAISLNEQELKFLSKKVSDREINFLATILDRNTRSYLNATHIGTTTT